MGKEQQKSKRRLTAALALVVLVLTALIGGLAGHYFRDDDTQITRTIFGEEMRRLVAEVGPVVNDLR
jgi:hypothetical protein